MAGKTLRPKPAQRKRVRKKVPRRKSSVINELPEGSLDSGGKPMRRNTMLGPNGERIAQPKESVAARVDKAFNIETSSTPSLGVVLEEIKAMKAGMRIIAQAIDEGGGAAGGNGKTDADTPVEEFAKDLDGPPKSAMSAIERHTFQYKASIAAVAAKMFELMDSEDGYIALEDAVTFIRKSGNEKHTPTLQSIAVRYDTNGDGKIDLSEFKIIVEDVYSAKQRDADAQARGGDIAPQPTLADFDLSTDDSPADSLTEDGGDGKPTKVYKYCHFLRAQEAIDPNSTLGFTSTITTMFLLLYGAFLIPARLGFNSEQDAGIVTNTLDYFGEFWFLFDIVINLHLAFEDPNTGQLVVNLERIRADYKRSW
jgi:hypothetical protein